MTTTAVMPRRALPVDPTACTWCGQPESAHRWTWTLARTTPRMLCDPLIPPRRPTLATKEAAA